MLNVNTLRLVYNLVAELNKKYCIVRTGDDAWLANINTEVLTPLKEAVLLKGRLGVKIEYMYHKEKVDLSFVISELDLLCDVEYKIDKEISFDKVRRMSYSEIMQVSSIK